MGKQIYQMKDLMEKFGITRDTIKYYEKKGLLSSGRNQSGYRQYTEAEVHRIKNILGLKRMGFTLEDCEKFFASDSNEEQEQLWDTVEQKLESEIELLKGQLDRIRNYKERGIEDEQ